MDELRDSDGRRIKLLRPLGKGGFGAVFQAEVFEPNGLAHRMAVKLANPEIMQDRDLLARARDEARLMSQLSHDHVVRVHALTEVEGRAAVLMEFIEGVDCTRLMLHEHPGAMPPTVAGGIVERAASALHAAWTTVSPQTGKPLRVVHRDIKPGNVLVSRTGVVKVLDFGVARAEFNREAQTESVQFGTFRYMAPERLLENHAGPESDVFSLGVTLWELMACQAMPRLPPGRDSFAHTKDQRLAELMDATPVDPKTRRGLTDLLSRMLAYDLAERPTADEVESTLDHLLSGAKGPSVRNYARRVVPGLLEQASVEAQTDPDIAAFTRSLPINAAETAERPSEEPGPSTLAGFLDDDAEAPGPTSSPPAPRGSLWVAAAVALVAVVGLGTPAAWLLLDRLEPSLEDAPAEVEAEPQTPEPEAESEPEEAPAPAPPAVVEEAPIRKPEPTPIRVDPTPDPSPADEPPPPPESLEDEEVEEPPPVATHAITIRTSPPSAPLWVDDQPTPNDSLSGVQVQLEEGVHTLQATFGDEVVRCDLQVVAPRQVTVDKVLRRCQ